MQVNKELFCVVLNAKVLQEAMKYAHNLVIISGIWSNWFGIIRKDHDNNVIAFCAF